MSILSKLKTPGGSWDSKLEVLDVTSQHTLIQAAGYLKHALAHNGPVYFRGQLDKFPTMAPSLYRGCTTISRAQKRFNHFRELRNAVSKKAFITSTPEYAYDALLQHYGIRTNWLDVVDNIWVALWFSCHTALSYGRRGEYLHFERRRPTASTYAHIALIQPGKLVEAHDKPGLYRGTDIELIDLRTAAPSLYLRPHAQHGLLVRRIPLDRIDDIDLMPLVVGWIRIQLDEALRWLGSGDLLSVHSLFPPPHYDHGARKLLTHVPKDSHVYLGAIHHIGA
ncbi:FRG domain-containing protein [Sorangium sp. So ce394]|uniref:FRG domain-containing protein n=1 Tax=Sorangium sp. So ce394 TaxID=3133310 RepID=UPI003F5CADB1